MCLFFSTRRFSCQNKSWRRGTSFPPVYLYIYSSLHQLLGTEISKGLATRLLPSRQCLNLALELSRLQDFFTYAVWLLSILCIQMTWWLWGIRWVFSGKHVKATAFQESNGRTNLPRNPTAWMTLPWMTQDHLFHTNMSFEIVRNQLEVSHIDTSFRSSISWKTAEIQQFSSPFPVILHKQKLISNYPTTWGSITTQCLFGFPLKPHPLEGGSQRFQLAMV